MMYGFDRLVLQLHSRGHRVVISHPERSPVFARDPDLLARLVGSGALAQSTAGAYAGNFGRSAQRLAHELTRKGLIHIVASDAHGVSGRPPGLREPVAVSGFGQLLDWLCDGVPSSIVRGEPIPDRPRLPASSRRRLLMRRR
jgi:protein-tyrosine phosphatase